MRLIITVLILCIGVLLSSCEDPNNLRQKANLGDTGAMWKLSEYHYDRRESFHIHGAEFCHHLFGEVYWMHRAAKNGHKFAKFMYEQTLNTLGKNSLEFHKEDCFMHPDSYLANLMRDKNSQVYKEWNGFCANESCSKKTKNFNKAWYYNGQYISPSR